jgi:phosphate acyltransferase
MKIALDVMGGDFAPQNNIAGVKLALAALPQLTKLYLVGDPAVVQAELDRQGVVSPLLEIVESTSVVNMEDPATDAIRKKRKSSISVAMDLVKSNQADAVVSPGHTGASVAAGTFILGRLEGVERPAIASPMPSDHGTTLLIDAGANTAPKASHLVQNALMGVVYSRQIFGNQRPLVGLMSVGEEEGKGTELTREAYDLIKATDMNFRGNVEGTHIFSAGIDVIVCDGFTGNIVLKSCEATAKIVFKWVKDEFSSGSVIERAWKALGGMMVRPFMKKVKARGSYETYGGSPLLGCKGVVIIGHGSSPPLAIMNAIRVACEAVQHQINPQIEAAIQQYNESHAIAS